MIRKIGFTDRVQTGIVVMNIAKNRSAWHREG